MNPSMRTRLSPACGGLLLALLAGAGPLAADDTEIFFGQTASSKSNHPNVLFILDTSGSMRRTDSGQSGTRMQRLQDAMHEIIDSSTDINIGLMGLNGTHGGGSILYPVTPVEEVVCAGTDCEALVIAAPIRHVDDDTEEHIPSGRADVGGHWLTIGRNSGASEQRVGLRFRDLDIPQGATITSATLVMDAVRNNSGTSTLNLRAEAVDDSAPFSRTDNGLASRSLTQASVSHTAPRWVAGSTYEVGGLAALVQEVVSRSGWCGGNALSLMLTADGAPRSAKSLERVLSEANVDAIANPPTLRIGYEIGTLLPGQGCVTGTTVAQVEHVNDDAEQRLNNGNMSLRSTDLELPRERHEQRIGIRFESVAIPRGADIVDARILFEVDEVETGAVQVGVTGEASGLPQRYGNDRWDLSRRNATAASVQWRDLPESAVGTKMQTPDLSPIVTELVNRIDWINGQAMAFMFERDGGSGSARRTVESRDGEPANAPKLTVRFRSVVQPEDTSGLLITARDEMKQIIDDLYPDHGTPLLSAHYEAAQYLLGKPVDYGRTRGTGNGIRWKRISHPGSYTGGQVDRPANCNAGDPNNDNCRRERIVSHPTDGAPIYKTPLTQTCQTSHIVFLSDGQATSDNGQGKIRNLIGQSSCDVNSRSEGCGTDLARWLNTTDHNQNVARKQNIVTHTVGFNLDNPRFMETIAEAGGGGFYTAESSSQLVDVFQTILGGVNSIDTSFTAPGATVNQFNRLTHRDDVYFALFKPQQQPMWAGNMKRYRVARVDPDDPDSESEILGADGRPAIDPDTGFFAEDAHSFWVEPDGDGGIITTPDGDRVDRGGAAARIALEDIPDTGERNVYTYLGEPGDIPPGGIDLSASVNALHEDNGAITDQMLGIVNARALPTEQAAYRRELLRWIRGMDTQDIDDDGVIEEARRHMGDPMHSRPLIVNYRSTTAGSDSDSSMVYVATNEGMLHGIDTANGDERWAYTPRVLLPNHQEFYDNDPATRHPYGLDGTMSVWLDDPNENFMVEAGESAYLFVGMRRGGNRYYAFNVTDPLRPRLAWSIAGGADGTPGFEQLGQSWSRMTPAKMRIDGVVENVLVFGGGYDTRQDPDKETLIASQPTDTVGRGLYVVRTTTGELLWSALGVASGPAGRSQVFDSMDYSMPGDVRVVDINMDGLVDQLYAADMGGQVWRFDVDTDPEAADLLRGGVLARLNGTRPADHRRFYNEPDVALIAKGGTRFMAVSIGSGWRAHPLNDVVEDRLYVLKSPAIRGAPEGYGKPSNSLTGAAYTPITEADLLRVGAGGLLAGQVASPHGWYVPLPNKGEKVLGRSVIFENTVYFSTYVPENTALICDTAIGSAYAYALDILDGSASRDLDRDGMIEESDRRIPLNHGGIPPEPTILMPQDGSKPILLFGTEKVDSGLENNTTRTYWADTGPAAALPAAGAATSDPDEAPGENETPEPD